MAYATSADYESYTGQTAPADIERLLDRASEWLDTELLLGAVYDVDAAGLPTDTDVIAALRDATCAQVELWQSEGEDVDVSGPVQSVGIGSVNIQYGAGRASAGSVAPRAVRALQRPALAGYPGGKRKLTLGVVT